MLHDGARQFDRVPDVGDAAHGAGLEIAAVHDCRVQFVAAVESEYRTMPCVEQGIVFEENYRARHRVQTRAARLQHAESGVQRCVQPFPIFQFSLAACFSARQCAGSAMNR
jgi:hypothetical protein